MFAIYLEMLLCGFGLDAPRRLCQAAVKIGPGCIGNVLLFDSPDLIAAAMGKNCQ
jgi:hypothetical protein